MAQTKQCKYNIPCDYGRRTEESIKEHKHNLAQSLFQKSKSAQHGYEEGHKIGWEEAKLLQIEPNITYRKYKEYAHNVSGRSSDQSTQLGLLHQYLSRSQKTTAPSSVHYV
jgi:hypothetical protein